MRLLRIPSRFLRGAAAQLVLTVLALAAGVALFCALDLATTAVTRAFVSVAEATAGQASVQVTVDDSGRFSETLAPHLATIRGIAAVVPVVSATAFTTEATPRALSILGVHFGDGAALRRYAPDIEAPADAADAILLTRAVATRFGAAVGDRVELDTPTGRHAFTVAGVLPRRGIGRAVGGNIALVDLPVAQRVFTAPGLVNRIDLVTDPAEPVAVIARDIREAVPLGVRVERVAARGADLATKVLAMTGFLQAFGVAALAAAFIVAFNRFSTMFEQRRAQLGTMRAIGVSRQLLWRELLKEGVVVALLSVGVGLAIGVWLAQLLLPWIADTMALNFRTDVPSAVLEWNVRSLLLAAALGGGAAILAALLPAWRAANVDVARAALGRPAIDREEARWRLCAGLAASTALSIAMQHLTASPVWGIVATALLMILAGALARPLLQLLRSLGLARTPAVGAPLRFALRELGTNLRRTTHAAAMVAIGAGTIVWLAIVAYSFQRTAVDAFTVAMRADAVVSSAHIGAGALEMPVADSLADTVAAVPGVASVVGIRVANWRYRGADIVLDAFDPAYFQRSAYGHWPLEVDALANPWPNVAAGTAVVVSSNFAKNLGVRVGEVITLDSPNGPVAVTVAGITTDFASPTGTIEMSRALYRAYWNDPTVTRLFVEAAPGTGRDALRATLVDRLAQVSGTWQVTSADTLVAYWGAQIWRAFGSFALLVAIVLGVIVFGIADGIASSADSRASGMLHQVGVPRRALWRIVGFEAAVITATGLTLALLTGSAIGALWIYATVPYALGWSLDAHVPLWVLPLLGMAAVFVAALCTVVPAALRHRFAE